MKYNLQSLFYVLYTMLAAGFLADGSRQEKASVRLPCLGKKLAANLGGLGVSLKCEHKTKLKDAN